jgi:GT2 family glycosyltransferase
MSAGIHPEIALVVSTYQQPEHLRRSLLSIACQRGVGGPIEVAVADDGSVDHTPRVVEDFASKVSFPVRFVTHPHTTHHVARCRNEGAAITSAPYLLFLDGDCVLPPDHVRRHLFLRRRGFATGAACCRLDQETTQRLTDDAIRSGAFTGWTPRDQRRELARLARRAWWYNLIRHPTKPKLIGNNMAVWREDFERVNGFDEKFQGWGCEDDDFRLRLRQAHVRVQSIVGRTHTFHLWHPTDPTAPRSGRWRDGANVEFIRRPYRLTRCMNGLRKRRTEDLRLKLIGKPHNRDLARQILAFRPLRPTDRGEADVEVLFLPGEGRFSGGSNCRLLVVAGDSSRARSLAAQAHLVVADDVYPGLEARRQFRLQEIDRAMRAVA